MESITHSEWVCRFAEKMLSLGSRANISALYQLGCDRFEVGFNSEPERVAASYIAMFGLPREPDADWNVVQHAPGLATPSLSSWVPRGGDGVCQGPRQDWLHAWVRRISTSPSASISRFG